MESNADAGHPDRSDGKAGQRTDVSAASSADALRWRQVFKGEERQLRVMRRWLSSLLPDCPARDDLLSVATELASNAIQHTASGRGAWFAVEITWYPLIVQVAVADCGGPAEPHLIENPDGERGRGLLLVQGLSVRTGFTGDQRGRLVWAHVRFHDSDPAALWSSRDPHQAAVRDDEAALACRFADVPAWFGRSTLAWWALAGSGGLVTAPTARELAGKLHRLEDASFPLRARAAYEIVATGRDTSAGSPQHRPVLGSYPGRAPGAGQSGGRDDSHRSRRRPGEGLARARMAVGRLRSGPILAL